MASYDDEDLPQEDLLREKLDQMNPQKGQSEDFLNAISQIESSGGQNLNHPVIQAGPQAGQQAIGSYGLLPNTIQELTNRARLENKITPEMEAAARNPASIGSNPELEQQYAQQLADRVLHRFPDPAMAAYAWNSGHNLTPEQVKHRDFQNNPYVQKFSKIWHRLGHK